MPWHFASTDRLFAGTHEGDWFVNTFKDNEVCQWDNRLGAACSDWWCGNGILNSESGLLFDHTTNVQAIASV